MDIRSVAAAAVAAVAGWLERIDDWLEHPPRSTHRLDENAAGDAPAAVAIRVDEMSGSVTGIPSEPVYRARKALARVPTLEDRLYAARRERDVAIAVLDRAGMSTGEIAEQLDLDRSRASYLLHQSRNR